VLVINDTMRRDRVGLYGGPARTPAFDAFGRANLWFARAMTQSPWTKPALATLFTSLYPSQHGVLSHPSLDEVREGGVAPVDVLDARFTTLAETLRAAGYETAAIVTNPWLDHGFGFAQGFEHFDDTRAGWDVTGSDVSRAALEWLARRRGDRPFFLYVHYMDSHRPYPEVSRWDIRARAAELLADEVPRDPRARQVVAENVLVEGGVPAVGPGLEPAIGLLEMAYDRGIEHFDHALGELLAGITAARLDEDTAILVAADHGESLLRRGLDDHGNCLYDDEVAIPLAVRLPGVAADEPRLECAVGLIDLLPTLCTYLGIDCPAGTMGRSLLAPAREAARSAGIGIEGVMHKPHNRAIVAWPYKLLVQPEDGPDGVGNALFDLERDPGERTNLLEDATLEGKLDELTRELAVLIPEPAPAAPAVTLDPEQIERLRALGYLK
jgi:arylsulfatase A-like enzyme